MTRPVFVLPKSLEAVKDFALLGEKMETGEGEVEVESLIGRALQEHPEHGLSHAAQAWFLSRRKEYVDAIEAVNRAIELGPEAMAPQWYLERGVYQAFLNRWRPALEDMTTACRLWPEDVNSHYLRSIEFKKLGDGLSGVLEEHLSLHLKGDLSRDDLLAFISQYSFYANPERLEATLMVLCDPLNPNLRAYRAELMLRLGVPTAAYHDYHVATRLDPRHLGMAARLEDLQQNGLMVDEPLFDVEKPEAEIWPVYQAILADYNRTLASLGEFQADEKISWSERVLGRVSSKLKYNNHRTGWNFIIHGMLISAVSTLYAISLHTLISFTGLNRFPAGFSKPVQYDDIIRFSRILAAISGIANVYGICLSINGVLRIVRGTRKRVKDNPVERLGYFIVAVVMFCLFTLASQVPYQLILAIYSKFNFN